MKGERAARIAAITTLIWVANGPGGAQAQGGRADKESFLRTAEIVSREITETGITLPERVELHQDGVHRSALFKSTEIVFPAHLRIGREVQEGLRDSWQYEVAAYELDKLLGLDMVPVAVVRTIEDRQGVLIDWVDEVLPDYGASPEGLDLAAWDDQVATVWLFDYLAYNVDRTPENLLVTPGFGIKLIDHSRAFQRFLVPMRPLSRFPRAVIERLRVLSDDEIVAPLATYLVAEEIDALLERRRRVLHRVDSLLETKPEDEVLF